MTWCPKMHQIAQICTYIFKKISRVKTHDPQNWGGVKRPPPDSFPSTSARCPTFSELPWVLAVVYKHIIITTKHLTPHTPRFRDLTCMHIDYRSSRMVFFSSLHHIINHLYRCHRGSEINVIQVFTWSSCSHEAVPWPNETSKLRKANN